MRNKESKKPEKTTPKKTEISEKNLKSLKNLRCLQGYLDFPIIKQGGDYGYNTIQYNTIQCNTIQYKTIQNNTKQYNTIQCNTMQYNTIQSLLAHAHLITDALTNTLQW